MAITQGIFRRTERLLTINPSAEITAIFGFMLAGLIIKDAVK